VDAELDAGGGADCERLLAFFSLRGSSSCFLEGPLGRPTPRGFLSADEPITPSCSEDCGRGGGAADPSTLWEVPPSEVREPDLPEFDPTAQKADVEVLAGPPSASRRAEPAESAASDREGAVLAMVITWHLSWPPSASGRDQSGAPKDQYWIPMSCFYERRYSAAHEPPPFRVHGLIVGHGRVFLIPTWTQ